MTQQRKDKSFRRRTTAMAVVTALILVAFVLRLVQFQLVQGEAWNDSTPLTTSRPPAFTGQNADGTDGGAALAMKEHFGRQSYATAQQVFGAAVARYGLADYAPAEQRTLLGLRYEMERRGYSNTVPFPFADRVSDKTVPVIRENGTALPGVEIEEVAVRTYPNRDAAAHMLGRIGLISEAEWVADGRKNLFQPKPRP